MSAEQIYAAIQTLPLRERLRLLERVIHALASSAEEGSAGSGPSKPSTIGMWADEAELAGEMVEGLMKDREARRLRDAVG